MPQVSDDLTGLLGKPGVELRGKFQGTPRGKCYVGQCPFCKAEQMTISPRTQVCYCFGCQKGARLKGATRDILREMFVDKDERQYPPILHLELILPPERNDWPLRGMRLVHEIADELPAPLVPFFECATLTAIFPYELCFSFAADQSIAFDRCSREDAMEAITRVLGLKLGAPVRVRMTLDRAKKVPA